MADYLLQVEGINLGAILSDTQDLSTIRGSGLLLLRMVDAIEAILKAKGAAPKAIIKGASIGLFQITATDDNAAQYLADRIARRLRGVEFSDKTLETRLQSHFANNPTAALALKAARFATFALALVPHTGNFIKNKERLRAKIRLAQMREPTIPAEESWGLDAEQRSEKEWKTRPAARVCEINKVGHAMAEKKKFKGGEQWVSDSVWTRRGLGRDQKHRFYVDELTGNEADGPQQQNPLSGFPQPAHDFRTIADTERDDNLNNKIAVLYVDGNGFGKIQNMLLERAGDDEALAAQETYETALRNFRRDLLKRLLYSLECLTEYHDSGKPAVKIAVGKPDDEEAEIRKNQGEREPFDKDRTFRFETLLWGGDEMMFVMPAAAGWPVAQLFFDCLHGDEKSALKSGRGNLARAKALKLPMPKSKGSKDTEDYPLHFGAGLVFCSHKADIDRVAALAKDIADPAKDAGKKSPSGEDLDPKNYKSLLAYQVLESFDFLGRDALVIRKSHWPKGLPFDMAHLSPVTMRNLRTAVEYLRDHKFPARRLKLLEQALYSGETWADGFPALLTKAIAEHECLRRLNKESAPLENLLTKDVSKETCPPAIAANWLHIAQLWDYLTPCLEPPPAPAAPADRTATAPAPASASAATSEAV